MTAQDTPYKVTRAPTRPQKRTHLLLPCQFKGGPLNGAEQKVAADEHGLPPPVYVLGSHMGLVTPGTGSYRNLPGTRDYYWK